MLTKVFFLFIFVIELIVQVHSKLKKEKILLPTTSGSFAVDLGTFFRLGGGLLSFEVFQN